MQISDKVKSNNNATVKYNYVINNANVMITLKI
jgi:hypothetical protein